MQDQMPPNDMNSMPDHGPDREGAMAKADLYKLANYSLKLFKQMQDEDQLEGWVQAKITKAADYIASVYHYMEYEMKFSEYGHHLDNSDTLSEGQKRALKGKLMEAKEKMKELKKKQATKSKGKKEKEVDENLVPVPNPSGADSAEKAKELGAKMPKPAGSDKDPISEETSSTGGKITREKGKVRHSHNPDRFTDEPHGEVASKAKAQSASDKAGDKAADKAEEKEGKNWEKRFGKGSVTRVKDGKKVDEAMAPVDVDGSTAPPPKGKDGQYPIVTSGPNKGKRWSPKTPGPTNPAMKEGKKPDFLDMDKDGDKKEPMKKAVADKKKNPFAKKTNEELKGGQKNLDADDDGDIEADDLADLRAKKEKKVDEANAKPSAANTALKGLSGAAALYFGGKAVKTAAEIAKAKEDAKKDPAAPADPNAPVTSTPVKETSKPSAGLTKGQKSATVKDAKAGKDIGKPGKSFDKVAKAAGGGEKGTKIAAAAMWKNKAKTVKEVQSPFPSRNAGTPAAAKAAAQASEPTKPLQSVMPSRNKAPEVVKESAELNRMKEFLTRLNG